VIGTGPVTVRGLPSDQCSVDDRRHGDRCVRTGTRGPVASIQADGTTKGMGDVCANPSDMATRADGSSNGRG
jgi:hypothetical protein